jgi:hypothetical protein
VSYLTELARPWKVVTLAFGVSTLLYGAAVEQAVDWDNGVSFLMAGVAYLTAPQAVRLIEVFIRSRGRAWERLLLAVLLVWFGADGCYAIYWSAVNPVALDLMREANAPASALLFLLCGMLWKPRCSLLDMLRATSTTLHLR